MTGNRPFRFGVHTSDAQTGNEWATAAHGATSRWASRPCCSATTSTVSWRRSSAMTAAACRDRDVARRLSRVRERLPPPARARQGARDARPPFGWPRRSRARCGMDGLRLRAGRPLLRPARRPRVAVRGSGEHHQGVLRRRLGQVHGDHYTITDHEMYPTTVQDPQPAAPARRGRPADDAASPPRSRHRGDQPGEEVERTRGRTRTSPTRAEDAVDRKIDAIRDAAGDRYDDIELQIVVPFVILDRRPGGHRAGDRDALPATTPRSSSAPRPCCEPVRPHRHRRRDLRHARRAPRAVGPLVLRVQRRLHRHRRADRGPPRGFIALSRRSRARRGPA